jgi:hypothetical protein
MVKDRPFAYRLKSVTKLPEVLRLFPPGLVHRYTLFEFERHAHNLSSTKRTPSLV